MKPVYSAVGDQLKVYIEDESGYAEQLSPYLIVIRAFSDKRIVGVKINDVKELIAESPSSNG